MGGHRPPSETYLIYFDKQKIKKSRQSNDCLLGAPGGTRTPDLLVRSQTLYPAELRAHILLIAVNSNSFYIIMRKYRFVNTFFSFIISFFNFVKSDGLCVLLMKIFVILYLYLVCDKCNFDIYIIFRYINISFINITFIFIKP